MFISFFPPLKYGFTQNFFKVFYKVLFGRGQEHLLMCLSIFPEIPSTCPPWQCRVRRTERTRGKYLHGTQWSARKCSVSAEDEVGLPLLALGELKLSDLVLVSVGWSFWQSEGGTC